jgi:hypothetical protein
MAVSSENAPHNSISTWRSRKRIGHLKLSAGYEAQMQPFCFEAVALTSECLDPDPNQTVAPGGLCFKKATKHIRGMLICSAWVAISG